jgi:hypothetical protein
MWGMLAGIFGGRGLDWLSCWCCWQRWAFLAAWDLTRVVDRLALVQDPGMASVYAVFAPEAAGSGFGGGADAGPGGRQHHAGSAVCLAGGLTVLVLILVRVAISLLQRWE